MKKRIMKEELFFSMTWDYLNVFLPVLHRDSPKTAESYADGLTIFQRYVTDIPLWVKEGLIRKPSCIFSYPNCSVACS